MVGRDKEIAGQRQSEAATERNPLHYRYCGYLQHLDGAIGNVYIRDKRSEPVDVFSRPFPDFAAEAEMRPFGPDDKHANVAFAGLAYGDSQSLRKAQIQSVKGRVGQHDIADRAVSFKSDRRHRSTSPLAGVRPDADRGVQG